MTGGIECPCFLVLVVVILSRLDHDPDICSVRVPVAGSRKRNKKLVFILLGPNKTLNLQWRAIMFSTNIFYYGKVFGS